MIVMSKAVLMVSSTNKVNTCSRKRQALPTWLELTKLILSALTKTLIHVRSLDRTPSGRVIQTSGGQ